MKRRDFIRAGVASWATVVVSSPVVEGDAQQTQVAPPGPGTAVPLENAFYRVEVDAERGLIERLLDKESKVELISERRLADNFRLLLPLPDLEANYILGREQKLHALERSEMDLTLTWVGPLRNARGSFDIDVVLKIYFAGQTVQFRLDLRNKTPYAVAEVWYPILGGITGIGNRKDTREMIPFRGQSTETNLFSKFEGRSPSGGLGMTYVEAFWSYPYPMPMPWVSLYNQTLDRAMYFACHDAISRYKSVRFELHPGIGGRQYGGNWPRDDERDAKIPLGVKLHWAFYPYSQAGAAFEGPPVVLQFHRGDWHDSAQIYRRWFTSQFPILDFSKSWMRREIAFVDTMLLLPEGNLILKFKDIPEWAKDTLAYGVKSVLVSGWSVGGHDGSYPYYEPDPRLGTWDDLAASVRECHRLGLKVYFFVNIQPVRAGTEWYRRELHRYLCMDKWGVPYAVTGWGMGTLAARLGYTRPPILNACSGIPAFRQIIVGKIVKLAQIGADGVHIDKLWPGPGLDFNPLSTLAPDQATSEGRLLAVAEILKACRAINPDFAISNESAWDRTLVYSTVAWAWHDNVKDHVPVLKYTFPEWLPGLVAPQPYDYTPVNNAVRYGYQIFLGPGNYIAPDSMAWAPMRPLSRYVQEVIGILEGLKDTIHFGEFLDNQLTRVEIPEDTRFSTFRNPKTGKRACVLVNLGEVTREAVVAGFDDNENGPVRIYQPFEKARGAKLPAPVTIPSERLAIVAEE